MNEKLWQKLYQQNHNQGEIYNAENINKSYQQNHNQGEIYNAENINIVKEQIIKISDNEIKTRQLIAASPYKGLDKFDQSDTDLFFGRASLISSLIQVISQKNLILLFGASGSGKSSVILAGLIPKLKEKWRTTFEEFVFKPGKNPFISLSAALMRNNENEAELALEAENNTLVEIITNLKNKKKGKTQWLIYIDQFEELFTNINNERKRNSFINSLVHLYESLQTSQEQTVKIVMTMRADFLEQISFYPNLAGIIQGNMHLIPDMLPNELWLAIEQPAAKHGVVFEEGLVDEIINEFKGQAGLLPLLQYTLDLLWKRDNIIDPNDPTQTQPHPHTDRTLNLITYRELGGVTGALQQRANEIYQSLDQEQQEITKQIFLKLINTVETKSGIKTVSRRAERNEFNGELVENTLIKFIKEKLLVTHNYNLNEETVLTTSNKSPKNSSTVEVAHEILLDSWGKLKEWINDNKKVISIKNWLTNETTYWLRLKNENENKVNEELLKGSRLDELIDLEDKGVFDNLGGLSIDEQQFIQASIKYRDRSEQEKLERILDASISSSQLLFASNNKLDALVNLIKIGDTLQKELEKYEYSRLRFLIIFGKLFNELAEYNSIPAHEGIVSSISFSREEDEIFASVGYQDRIIKFWRRDGTQMKIIDSKHLLPIRDLTFSSDGEMLASASEDGSVKLWQTRILKEPEDSNQFIFIEQYGMPIGHEDDVSSISFNDKRKIIASASSDGTVKLWSYEDNTFKSLLKHKDQVFCVSCSPNGEIIAAGDCNGNVRLWNGDGELLKEFQAHSNSVSTVGFNPDNETLISCSSDKYIKLWHLHKESIEEPIIEFSEDEEVYCATFSPDGKKIASANKDGTIVIRFTDGKLLKTLKGHRGFVSKVIFSPDGKFLISSGEDGTIKFWHCQSRFEGHDDEIWGIDFSANGETLITASSDKTARLWKRNGDCLRILAHESKVYDAKLSPDGSTVVTVTVDGVIRIWNDIQANDHKVLCKPISISEAIANSISFSPTDDIFLMAGKDGTIKVFDLKGKLLAQKPTDEENLIMVTLSHNGKIIASTSNDKTVKLWKFDNEKLSQILEPLTDFEENVYHVSFSNDDQKIATVNQSGDFFEIKLWDLDGKIIKTIKGNHKDSIRDLRFNQDDQMIALVTSHCLEFWNLNGILLQSIQLNDINNDINNIFRASISHDWSAIALSYPKNDYENKVEFWNLNLKETVEDARRYLDEYLKLG
ncbi:WD-40 repeat protein [Nostoc linckia NIES-25]|nr:WD-40 repeat protein [Nostoc linckia NIES-25]